MKVIPGLKKEYVEAKAQFRYPAGRDAVRALLVLHQFNYGEWLTQPLRDGVILPIGGVGSDYFPQDLYFKRNGRLITWPQIYELFLAGESKK